VVASEHSIDFYYILYSISWLSSSCFFRFVLYGGNVLGKFEELVPEKRIQQSWRLKNWSSGHYSNVIIELEETVS